MIRGLGLRNAVALNVITMIGIGPLITIPLVLSSLHGPRALLGWILGAIIALCDGLVWSELSARYPSAGGTYAYLRETFGRERAGAFLSFLFNWQFLFFAPLLLASGYIGFAQYAAYLFPSLGSSAHLQGIVGAAVALLTIALLYRRVTSAGKLGFAFFLVAVATLLAVIAAAFRHPDFHRALSSTDSSGFGIGLFAGLGSALIVTLYDYVGYSDAALVAEEVRGPLTVPRSILISIVLVALLYITLQVGVLAAIPWQTIVGAGASPPPASQYVASTIVAQSWGTVAARVVTVLVLATAFASTYGNLLGFSRISYAAARDGEFFRAFSTLHPSGRFPVVSLIVIGLAAIPACFLPLGDVIQFLTTGIVLIQGIAQTIALFVLRARRERMPYRMWLFPLPAIIALLGWGYAFYASTPAAKLYGAGTLLAGSIAYCIWAGLSRRWPFKALAALAVALVLARVPAAASSAIVKPDGYPQLRVDGKPFFVYGASFFYERLPRSLWRENLIKYRALGINTIDLYVIWNWHEASEGHFDFSGATNPRRDLRELLRLTHALGFKLIVRPGPVIRNEWRNGGYPSWLLQRAAYRMPLHDILEGRYPATATLQNAHSDAAAAEWLGNAVHRRYAARWLRRALAETRPWLGDVIAIALDDDQGAYLDNETWPAPNFQRYLRYLRTLVQQAAPGIPVFINTYQMKVTAAAPVWAWGNWYQSDQRLIGEHDRSQLEFSTALLQTQTQGPVMASEFQAGWLTPPNDIRARETDPSNTELALHTLLATGAHGVVNFPVQDTLYPAGWEAPFANGFYAWDAALTLQGTQSTRYAPTCSFGRLIAKYGTELAASHRVADAAIAYLTSAYALPPTPARVSEIAGRTIAAQQWCRAHELSCDLVDLRYGDERTLRRYPVVLLPDGNATFVPAVRARLAKYVAGGGKVDSGSFPATASLLVASRAVRGVQGILLRSKAHDFLDVENFSDTALRADGVQVRDRSDALRNVLPFTVGPRSAVLFPLGVHAAAPPACGLANDAPATGLHVRSDASLHVRMPAYRNVAAQASIADLYEDGYPVALLQNAFVRIAISAAAGGRAFVFEDRSAATNIFTTVGAMRDDVATPLPPSPRDYIARYTHQMAAGTFNRPYTVAVVHNGDRAAVRLTYDAPDLPPYGARFERTLTLEPLTRQLDLDETVAFHRSGPQLAVSTSSLTVGSAADFPAHVMVLAGGIHPFVAHERYDGLRSFGLYDERTHELALVRCVPGTSCTLSIDPQEYSVLVRAVYRERLRANFSYEHAETVSAAQALL